MVDSHTHLSSCEPPDEELVAAAREAGVTRIVTIGTDPDNSAEAIAAAERFPEVYAAVGHHPNGATGFGDTEYAALERLARHPRCVAIGETGLDHYREHASHDDQARAFRAQIEIARSVGKPVVIHTREADDDTLAILDEHAQGVKVILHCFSMSDRVDECLAHPDWFFSFAGNVTYAKNEDLRQAMLKIPAGRLLCETDAPYLAPQPMRGQRNVPANVVHTAQALALERRVSYHDFNLAVEAASAAVFGW